MSKKLIQEMKNYSGVGLNESEISQAKTMSAESRLIGAFSSLLRELKFIQADAERINYYGYNSNNMTPAEKTEQEKTVDMGKLHSIAKEKLKVVEEEIEKTFKKEIRVVKAEEPEEDDE